ncbi:uncharacterized protein LOC107270036 [Cephus cinctus]|uniref:Protein CUSTOS n=1 Tax=Cephus cinctus TaxID=211228 RepID=A0AAJ7C254_CEPCN|nr:uncharacterized protein LOC107270036 [Cephus cinctus]
MHQSDELSSSSDDEISQEILKEAADVQYLNEYLFHQSVQASEKSLPKNLIEPCKKKPSLRNQQCQDQFQGFGTTQTFKDFIAKKLNDVLDRVIEEPNIHKNVRKRTRTKSISEKQGVELGIKLLNSSKSLLTDIEIEHVNCSKDMKVQKSMKDRMAEQSMIRDAAVDPEQVLSKIETKAWANNCRGKVFRYKQLQDGTLMEKK